jgi:hypothetical protein
MASFLQLINGVPRMVADTTVYDQTYTIPAGGVSAGVPITLPSSKTYNSSELEVQLNGVGMFVTSDYNYVGSVPRTQISFTYDLPQNYVVRFRIDRLP